MHNNAPETTVTSQELARYLAGECTAGERVRIDSLLQSDGVHSEIVRRLTTQALHTSEAEQSFQAEAGWNSVKEAVRRLEEPGDSAKDRAKSAGRLPDGTSPRWSSLWNLAWVVPMFAVAAWQLGFKQSAPKENASTTYVTRAGQHASLTLRDGSRVTLGPASTLRVLNTNATTDVEVAGEALFSVNHSARRPFTVTAHGVKTHVLGTEFVVRAYDNSRIRIAVRDGRVSVQSPIFTSANAVIVNAGEAATATPNALPHIAPIADLATDFAWANGELVLRKVPLGEALLRLSRWYGLEFRVTDTTLLGAQVQGIFPGSFSQEHIDVLAQAIKARATRSGNTITFSANR